MRKRRKHGEGNSHPLIFRASPSQDNGSDTPLWCCSAAVLQQRSCAQTSPRGDLLPQGLAAALLHTLYITEILQRDSKFLPKVEVELNIPLWVQFSNPSNAWEENKHSHVLLFFSLKFLPSLHLRTLLTITPDFIWASGLQKVLSSFRLCNECFA